MLDKQVGYVMRGLKLEREDTMGGEDAEQHLDTLLDFEHSSKTLIRPSADPDWDGLARLLIARTIGSEAGHLFLGHPLQPAF